MTKIGCYHRERNCFLSLTATELSPGQRTLAGVLQPSMFSNSIPAPLPLDLTPVQSLLLGRFSHVRLCATP